MNVIYPPYKIKNRPPNVLISGSYKESADNDLICKMLGSYLTKLDIGIISGAGKAGIQVSKSFCEMLDAENRYDEDKIIFYLRRKEKVFKGEMEHIGSIKFYGNHPIDLRRKMISKVSAVIVIGGKTGTLQEEELACIHHIPVIAVASSGGAASQIWERYKSNANEMMTGVQLFDRETFEALNSKNPHFAADAAFSLLKNILTPVKVQNTFLLANSL